MTIVIGFCLLQSFWGQSQNIETVMTKGYNSDVDHINRFSDGRWLITYVSSPLPGSIYEDTIYAAIIDSSAELIRQIKFSPLNFENLTLEKTLVFPNGEFLVMYSGGDCDAGGYGYFLTKFDSLMHSAWHFQMPEFYGEPALVISPDQNILFLIGEEVGKISSVDGSILWQEYFSNVAIYDVILDPGTENFIIASDDEIRYYEQRINQGDISYLQIATSVFEPQGYLQKLVTDGDGSFYVLKQGPHESEIFKFQNDLEYESLVVLSPVVRDVTASKGVIAALLRRNQLQYEILLYDTTGILMDNYISTESGLRPFIICADEDGFAIAGEYRSGTTSPYDSTYLYTGRSQGWFRYFPGYSFTDSVAEVSLAISEILQKDSIAIETYWEIGPWEGYLNDFEGGDFQLKITNTGNEVVNSFWINIAFREAVNTFWCNPRVTSQILVEDVAIGPGESYWYDYGDIYAWRQIAYPKEFCFWTSGPNYNPDFIPDDDVYCHQRIVSTQTIQDEHIFSIYPNPADDEINVTISESFLDDSEWVLVDILGRKIKLGNFESHSREYRIEVGDVPSGIYYLNAALLSKTIIIKHP